VSARLYISYCDADAKFEMTTIRIADPIHPVHRTRSQDDGASTGFNEGIYNMRSISRSSTREKRSIKGSEKEAEDDDPGLRQSSDYKTKQVWG